MTLSWIFYLSILIGHPSRCVVPENIHTHPMDGHWKFLGVGV